MDSEQHCKRISDLLVIVTPIVLFGIRNSQYGPNLICLQDCLLKTWL